MTGQQDFPATLVGKRLAELAIGGRGATVTWYNHHSFQRSHDYGIDFSRFSHVGLDGLLLRRILRERGPRTSADLVLPIVLAHLDEGMKIALIGGTAESNGRAKAAIERDFPHISVGVCHDGYSALPSPTILAAEMEKRAVAVVIIGLGAPRQDEYALAVAATMNSGPLIATCGGWLDQVSDPTYYPAYTYTLRLNWLIRLAREPGRLWRRYTVEALTAIRRAGCVREGMKSGRLGIAAMARLSDNHQ